MQRAGTITPTVACSSITPTASTRTSHEAVDTVLDLSTFAQPGHARIIHYLTREGHTRACDDVTDLARELAPGDGTPVLAQLVLESATRDAGYPAGAQPLRDPVVDDDTTPPLPGPELLDSGDRLPTIFEDDEEGADATVTEGCDHTILEEDHDYVDSDAPLQAITTRPRG